MGKTTLPTKHSLLAEKCSRGMKQSPSELEGRGLLADRMTTLN